jgi:site-specific DNA recombinase
MRVSSEDQAERGTIEAQRDFLRQFARLYDLTIADEYADDGVTGTLPLGERPQGRRLIEDATHGRFGQVIVMRVDRLGRSLRALLSAHTALSEVGVTIRSATEPFDTATPIGIFLFQLLGSMAELEKSTIIERMTHGRDRVAKQGKWTDGPVPFGYALSPTQHLIPSERMIDSIGMTEAHCARDILTRIAGGSTTIAEAKRLQALMVPTTRYYTSGKAVTVAKKWQPSRIAFMVNNAVYMGRHVVKSQHGTIEREVPALIDEDLWNKARAQLQKNRTLPKGNETRYYLLRGLITCGQCGAMYVGQAFRRSRGQTVLYYRCGQHAVNKAPTPSARCPGRMVSAEWLEGLIWAACRDFICNPGAALEEARAQLHQRLSQVARLEAQRDALRSTLAEKALEKDRVLTMFRRGRISLNDADTHLEQIAQEEAALSQQLAAMDAQATLAEAFESHMTEMSLMLTRLQANLEEIERSSDLAAIRRFIELFVRSIRVETDIQPGPAPRRKTATVYITYVFGPAHVAASNTACGSGIPGLCLLARAIRHYSSVMLIRSRG